MGLSVCRIAIIARLRSLCSFLRSAVDSTLGVLPRIAATFLITFLTVGLITFNSMSANGFANKADVVAITAMPPVVVIAPALGIAWMI